MKKEIAVLIVAATLASVPIALTTGCAVTSGRESVGSYAHDKEITARIKTAMLADPGVKGTQVNVTTLKGEVQLSGFVQNEQQKQRAEQIASQTPGVTKVYNNLLLPTGRENNSSQNMNQNQAPAPAENSNTSGNINNGANPNANNNDLNQGTTNPSNNP